MLVLVELVGLLEVSNDLVLDFCLRAKTIKERVIVYYIIYLLYYYMYTLFLRSSVPA